MLVDVTAQLAALLGAHLSHRPARLAWRRLFTALQCLARVDAVFGRSLGATERS